MDNIDKIILIQKIVRGYLVRHKNKSLKDSMTFELLEKYIDAYSRYVNFQREINNKFKSRKIRLANFPSEISENICKFAIKKKYNIIPTWDTNSGDLLLINKKLEVKASTDLFNGGPSSFGPKENWDCLYFVDCIDSDNKRYKIWEINLSNNSDIWKNIKVNKTQTYHMQCLQGRRPRLKFNDLIRQIPEQYIKIIFNDYMNVLI